MYLTLLYIGSTRHSLLLVQEAAPECIHLSFLIVLQQATTLLEGVRQTTCFYLRLTSNVSFIFINENKIMINVII